MTTFKILFAIMELYRKDTQDHERGWDVSCSGLVDLWISVFQLSDLCLQKSGVKLVEPRRMSNSLMLLHCYLVYSKCLQGNICIFDLLILIMNLINKISNTDMYKYYHCFLLLSLKITSVLLLRILVCVCSVVLQSTLLLDFWTLLTACEQCFE